MKETSFIVLLLLSSTFGSVIFKRSLEQPPKLDIDKQDIFDVRSYNPPPRLDRTSQDIFVARSINPPPRVDRTFEDIRASKARSFYVPPPRLDRTVEDIRASKARSAFIPRPRLDRTTEDIRASKARSAFILRPRLDRTNEDIRASKAKSIYVLRPRLDRTTEDIRASEVKALSNQKQLDVKVQDQIVIAKRSLEQPEKPEKNLQKFFDSYNASPRLDKTNQNSLIEKSLNPSPRLDRSPLDIYTSKSSNPSPRLDRTVEDIRSSKARSTFVLRPRLDRTTEDIRASKARSAYVPRPRLDRTIEDIRASKARSVYGIRPRLDRTVEDIQKSETEYLKQVSKVVKENSYAASKTPTCTKYKFRTTPNPGTYSEARTMCLTLGGDLLSKNIGPNGAQYHAILRRLIEDHSAHYWIGLTDIEDDNKFHLLDGSSYDPSDMTQLALYYWSPGQPNLNYDERCGLLYFEKTTLAYGLGNWYCKAKIFQDKPIKGICEICESWTV